MVIKSRRLLPDCGRNRLGVTDFQTGLFGSGRRVEKCVDSFEFLGDFGCFVFVVGDIAVEDIAELISLFIHVEFVVFVGRVHVGRILIEEVNHLGIGVDRLLIRLVVVTCDVEACFALIEQGVGLGFGDSFADIFKTFGRCFGA